MAIELEAGKSECVYDTEIMNSGAQVEEDDGYDRENKKNALEFRLIGYVTSHDKDDVLFALYSNVDFLSGVIHDSIFIEIVPNSGTRLQQIGEYDRMDPKIVSVFSVIESANAQGQDVLSGDNGPLLSSGASTMPYLFFMINEQNNGPLHALLTGPSILSSARYISTRPKKPNQKPKQPQDQHRQIIHIQIYDMIHELGLHTYQISEEDEYELETRSGFNCLLEDYRTIHEVTKIGALIFPWDEFNPFVGYHVEYKSGDRFIDIDNEDWDETRLILTTVVATYLGW